MENVKGCRPTDPSLFAHENTPARLETTGWTCHHTPPHPTDKNNNSYQQLHLAALGHELVGRRVEERPVGGGRDEVRMVAVLPHLHEHVVQRADAALLSVLVRFSHQQPVDFPLLVRHLGVHDDLRGRASDRASEQQRVSSSGRCGASRRRLPARNNKNDTNDTSDIPPSCREGSSPRRSSPSSAGTA